VSAVLEVVLELVLLCLESFGEDVFGGREPPIRH
jgi:hypothetical protein